MNNNRLSCSRAKPSPFCQFLNSAQVVTVIQGKITPKDYLRKTGTWILIRLPGGHILVCASLNFHWFQHPRLALTVLGLRHLSLSPASYLKTSHF